MLLGDEAKGEESCNPIAMTTSTDSPYARWGRNGAGRPRRNFVRYYYDVFCSEKAQQDKNAPGGRRNPLKRLDPDKEIKVNSFDFLWPGLAGYGQDLARFGFAWPDRGAAPGQRR
jgi:hypothetical protein